MRLNLFISDVLAINSKIDTLAHLLKEVILRTDKFATQYNDRKTR